MPKTSDRLEAPAAIQTHLTAIFVSLEPLAKFPEGEGFPVFLRSGASAAQAGAGLKLVTRSI